MNAISRRRFLGQGAAALAALPYRQAHASPLGLPIGLQLYSVAEELAADFDGTLKQIASIGYTHVELTGFGNRTAADLSRALGAAGLRGSSAHYSVPELESDPARAITYAAEIGLDYMICAFPRIADPAGPPRLTADDWKWNAELFNSFGDAARKAGITFGYHNHNLEFRRFGTETGLEMLLRLTDPALVAFQMDCSWVAAAGLNPAALLARHPGRFRLLHLKDVKPGFHPNTDLKLDTVPLGQGTIDWPGVFAAAKTARVEGYYVELEPPHRRPALAKARADYAYLNRFS